MPNHGGNLVWAAQVAHCHPELILDFSASINPNGPPASAIAAITNHLDQLKYYPDPSYTEFRNRLAMIHNVSPDWILLGNGSAELLTWVGRELSQLKNVYLITPAFGDYSRALMAFGANIICEPLDSDWNLGNPLKIIPNSGLLLSNPHNPTGKLWKVAELLALLDQLELLVVDEAFMDFIPLEEQETLIPLVEDYSNLIILRSLTKFYSLPGLRLGYVITHPDRLRLWQSWRDPWPVNCLSVAAGMAVLSDDSFQSQTYQWLQKARSQLYSGLKVNFDPYPSSANFILVKSLINSTELTYHLLKNDRILIRDCVTFPELGNSYFRVAVRTYHDNERLLTALNNYVGL